MQPKKPANKNMDNTCFVHCRAAAAGAISMVLMSTTPTICKPITMVNTSIAVNNNSMIRAEKPREEHKTGSKTYNDISFQNNTHTTKNNTAIILIIRISIGNKVATEPKKNLFKIACSAREYFCTTVINTNPRPKKTDNTIPSTASFFSVVCVST